MSRHLNLIFPQWQGSGSDTRLFYGAPAVSALCPGLAFSTVPVPETGDLKLRNKILGYDDILTQMRSAGTCIRNAAPETILTLGGDCGTEVMPVSWLNRSYGGELTLIWLDAHADLNTPDTSPSGHFHGMPLATLLNIGDPGICSTAFSSLSPDQVILAGLRHPDPEEERLAGVITQVSSARMAASPEAIAAAVREKKNRRIYVHVDLDVLDPEFFPHVLCPEPGGLTPETLVGTIEILKTEFTIVGMGLVEFTLPEAAPSKAMASLPYIKTLIDIFRQT